MVNKILSEDYADLIIQNRDVQMYAALSEPIPIDSRYSMINVPVSEINKCSFREFGYQPFPLCFITESIVSLAASRVPNVQRIENLGMFGQGVLVAVIDTGIEYQHEAFRQADNTTRIHSIWDQTIDDPENYTDTILYGKEFTREMINEALNSEDPLSIVPSVDEVGHGTAIAGIIGGNESRLNNFSGVVPRAEYVVVKLKQAKIITKEMYNIPADVVCYQETDIMFAVNYIKAQAEILQRPVVICIAVGTNQGSHDGRGVLSFYLSEVADLPGMAVVISAGNEGASRRHFYGLLTSNMPLGEFQMRVGAGERGLAIELWKASVSRISIDIISPTGSYVPQVFPSLYNCSEYDFVLEPTKIWINNYLIERGTGDQLVLIRFQDPIEGIWRFRVYNLDQQTTDYHVWLPATGMVTADTYFLEPNPDTTITSPGNSFVPITITAYNHANNSIYFNASRGLTRLGVLKPELAAPGVDIVCPVAGNRYGTATGTGAAAAHAAGIVAMLLEWGVVKGNNRSIDGGEIKTMLIRGANRNELEGINNIWGYGRIDVYGVFEALRY